MTEIDENAVRDRAYQLWEADGRKDGEHDSHWHQALAELGLISPAEQPEGTTVLDGPNPAIVSRPLKQ